MSAGLLLLLVLSGMISGFMDGVLGLGGGLVLIAALSWQLPPQDIVVATAPVLLMSSLARAGVFRRGIDWPVVAWHSLGGVPAVAAGGLLLARIPTRGLELLMGLFLVSYGLSDLRRSTPPEDGKALDHRTFIAVGALSGFVAATVGGAGPLIVPFLRRHGLDGERFVGTMAAIATATLTLKTATYWTAGLLRSDLATTVLVLAASALSATWITPRLFRNVRTGHYRRMLDIVVIVAGARLLVG